MKVIVPAVIDDTVLTASNLAENDHPAWNAAATYDAATRVIHGHSVFENIPGGNTVAAPDLDDGTGWLRIGATNRWRAFDRKISAQVARAGVIHYSFTARSLITGISLLNLNASVVRVRILDVQGAEIYNVLRSLVDTSEIIDWLSIFTFDPLSEFDSEAIFDGVPGYIGNRIEITIGDGTGTAEVGQILLGKVVTLGITQTGTSVGIADYSTKERDPFGNPEVVERGFADKTAFQFALPTSDVRRVKRVLASLRATPALYFVSEQATRLGAQTFGFFGDFDIPLDAGGTSFATLDIEGLT